jgi:hypothetical protein
MSYVVKEGGESQVLPLVFIKDQSTLFGSLKYPDHDPENAEAVGETRVRGVRIREVTHSDLFDVAKTLKRACVNNGPFMGFQMNITMNGVND